MGKLRCATIAMEKPVADEAAYKDELESLQKRMLNLQQAYLMQGHRAALLFEGWDAAGKGSAIRRLTEGLDPRAVKVWPIGAPTAAERGMPYLHRFWTRLPEPRTIAIFDRSWYGRVLVERVDDLAPKAVWRRAYDEINAFEKMLIDDGMRVVKIFLHVSKETQVERFRERIAAPHKRWKITADDFHNLSRRKDYLRAYDDMFDRTDTKHAPWFAVGGEHKWAARLEVLRIVLRELSRGVDLTPPQVDPAILKAARNVLN
jgi:polyphosphate kinase 2 (PPK2 family)